MSEMNPYRLAASFFLALICLAANARTPLPSQVADELRKADIPQSAVAVVVQEAGKRTALVDLNSQQAMNPASVMKLVTTWAALETLGPAYTWTTKALAQGTISDGVLNGDLVIQGSGDPKFTQEQFWLLLRQVRARGVREIKGDLLLDRSAFAPVAQNASFDDTPLRAYNVAPDALLLNFNAVRLTLIPPAQYAGQRVTLSAEPPLTDLNIVNLIKASGGECNDWKGGLRADLSQHGGRYQLALTGSYPTACGEKEWNLGVLPHREFAGAVFRDLWRELGGTFGGTSGGKSGGQVRDGTTPADAKLLATIESPALSEIVRDINKYSNNVMARELFLSLAKDSPATTASAADNIKTWLGTKGIDAPELMLDNGAGLSRQERISAASLTSLLQAASASPLMPEFVASLPLAAVDGTMKKRLKDDGVAGHAHIKTGTLDGVKSMAGYVQDAKGRNVIVVFLVNHRNAQSAQAAEDALLSWVYQR